jgi:hypothetical protein
VMPQHILAVSCRISYCGDYLGFVFHAAAVQHLGNCEDRLTASTNGITATVTKNLCWLEARIASLKVSKVCYTPHGLWRGLRTLVERPASPPFCHILSGCIPLILRQ